MPLHVYYDTRLAPTTFDMAVFLVGAEQYRKSIGVTSSYVYIISPQFRGKTAREKLISEDEMRWRAQHILLPLPHLIPSTQRVAFQNDTFNQISYPNYPPNYPPVPSQNISIPYVPSVLAPYVEAGMDVQPFTSCKHAIFLVRNITAGHEYVTITLRCTKFQPERNSDLESWYQVYKELTKRGIKVWVVPDFEDVFGARKAFQYDWPIADFAIYNLQLRLALYLYAKDNLFVSNGIGSILMFSKSPFKMFRVSNQLFNSTNDQYFAKYFQIEAGQSPRFFQDYQRWIWEDDKPDKILESLDL